MACEEVGRPSFRVQCVLDISEIQMVLNPLLVKYMGPGITGWRQEWACSPHFQLSTPEMCFPLRASLGSVGLAVLVPRGRLLSPEDIARVLLIYTL